MADSSHFEMGTSLCSPSSTILLLSFFLLLSATASTKDLEDKNESTEEEKAEEFFEETSENVFPLDPTTTEATAIVETHGKLTLPTSEKNISKQFKPSVHLGEIKEPRVGTGPFNNVHHIRFENDIDPTNYRQQVNGYEVVLQPTVPLAQPGQGYQGYQSFLETEEQKGEQNGFVKFQDAVNIPVKVHYGSVSKDQLHQFPQLTSENAGAHDLMDQQVFQNLEKPVYEQDASSFFGKPSKLQTDAQKHELGSLSNAESLRSPYIGGFHEHQGHQPMVNELDALRRPNNGVVYVQESTFLTTRKFPYPLYQPVGYHQANFIDPARRRVSPWKKILHLIGAFLPFGLLLAALTPNIVKVDNTTQPNIVLSKWRVADLPVEHKQARFSDESSPCEERSICELICAGSKAESSILQSLLWNLATRTSATMARENDLQEIFEAVKNKNCTNLLC
ncbi:uncharacterized protein LOC143181416 [Calliopsis andreniformis]|uniref:uncharacterized protein LOC143181416 n=1 Tax=Calliopsis andreniformis TaxID=337506 RepID=UPI003FCECF1C